MAPAREKMTCKRLMRLGVFGLGGGLLIGLLPWPALAATNDLTSVIDNLRIWLAGLLAGIATLFLTIGGIRYMTAAGDPHAVQQGKEALKSALIGYILAGLAPLLVSIVARIAGF